MIPAKLDEVDHIIYLPRVSSHILAGRNMGFKLGVGFLRSDSRRDYHKRFSDRMWPNKDGRETPAIDYFKPGNLCNPPVVVNYLKRMGGRPRVIAVEEINKQPDGSVIEYLKKQLKI